MPKSVIMSENKKKKIEGLDAAEQVRDEVDEENNTATNINYWSHLSDEIVLYILRSLPQKDLVALSMMNKKFRDLSRDDSLWTELNLLTKFKFISTRC